MKIFKIDFKGTCVGEFIDYVKASDEDLVYNYVETEYKHHLCSQCFPKIEEVENIKDEYIETELK